MKKDICQNRKAEFDYFLEDRFEAGLVLTGTEIKSIRAGHVHLTDAYGWYINGEFFLTNSHIAQYPNAIENHEPTRQRKLLLHKKEINKIFSKIKLKGYSFIPTRMYFVNGYVKCELALAKGKNTIDKRNTEKERDINREIHNAIKGKF